MAVLPVFFDHSSSPFTSLMLLFEQFRSRKLSKPVMLSEVRSFDEQFRLERFGRLVRVNEVSLLEEQFRSRSTLKFEASNEASLFDEQFSVVREDAPFTLIDCSWLLLQKTDWREVWFDTSSPVRLLLAHSSVCRWARSREIESCQFVVEAEERGKTGKASHAVYGSECIVVATQIIESLLPRYV